MVIPLGNHSNDNFFPYLDDLVLTDYDRSMMVEIVTPRQADVFLDRIAQKDPTIDHLCLELCHWGFDEAMAWIYKVHSVCKTPKTSMPVITIHGEVGDTTLEMERAIHNAGAIWLPRRDEEFFGKDCATIIYEMCIRRNIVMTNGYAPLVEDYDLEMINSDANLGIPDAEFEDLLRENLKELNND
jgi:hypothetical protein